MALHLTKEYNKGVPNKISHPPLLRYKLYLPISACAETSSGALDAADYCNKCKCPWSTTYFVPINQVEYDDFLILCRENVIMLAGVTVTHSNVYNTIK